MADPLGIIISGIKGRMGQAILSVVEESPDLELIAGLEHKDHVDLGSLIGKERTAKVVLLISDLEIKQKNLALIEFTTPKATLEHLDECVELNIPMVIGTTGFTDEEAKTINEAAKKIPIVMAPNFSVGINMMAKVVKELASVFPETYDLEIVEAHHNQKKDAPSGTALRLARALADGRNVYLQNVICCHREGETGVRPKGQIGVQTIRGGDIVGDHTVYFIGPGERIEVTHRAHNRTNFATGSTRAAQWLWPEGSQREPGLFDMFDVLGIKEE